MVRVSGLGVRKVLSERAATRACERGSIGRACVKPQKALRGRPGRRRRAGAEESRRVPPFWQGPEVERGLTVPGGRPSALIFATSAGRSILRLVAASLPDITSWKRTCCIGCSEVTFQRSHVACFRRAHAKQPHVHRGKARSELMEAFAPPWWGCPL